MVDEGPGPGDGRPAGGPYEWMRRAVALLEAGEAAQAVTLLARVHAQEPASTGVLEALARARYDSGDVAGAAETFDELARARPSDDYAHFGLGLSLSRLGRFGAAAEHLAIAHAMRPEQADYADRLRQVRATIEARRTGGDE